MSADTPQFNMGVSVTDGLALMDNQSINKNGGSQQPERIANAPPALDGPNDDTIWFEVVENPVIAKQSAAELGWNDAEKMDVAVLIIRDDFSEFYMPLNSESVNYEGLVQMLKDKHLKQAAKYNDCLEYNGDVKEIGIDDEEESGEKVDWVDMMDSEPSSGSDDSKGGDESDIEEDIEELFD